MPWFFFSSLLNADIASAAVLISFGAVLGKISPLQLVLMGIIETVIFAANEYLSSHVLKVKKKNSVLTFF